MATDLGPVRATQKKKSLFLFFYRIPFKPDTRLIKFIHLFRLVSFFLKLVSHSFLAQNKLVA